MIFIPHRGSQEMKNDVNCSINGISIAEDPMGNINNANCGINGMLIENEKRRKLWYS